MWYNSGVNHLPDNSLSCTPLSPITITYYGYYVTKQISAWHTSFKEQKWYFFLICDVLLLHDHLSPTLFWGQMGLLRGVMSNFVVHTTKSWMSHPSCCLRTCQKLAGGRGWKQRRGHNFLSLRKGRGHEKWAVKRGRVMQIYASDHVEVHPQKKKEVLYLAKIKRKNIRKTVYGT